MKIFPAIDLYGGKAVRLYKGDYNQMTVYSDNPVEIALDFKSQGALYMHVVDLEGAKTGDTPNLKTIEQLVKSTDMFVEVGGGIRSMDVIDRYVNIGVKRVILGTSAVTDRDFLISALKKYGDKIAVGVDIKDGYVAIKGWTEKSQYHFTFTYNGEKFGVWVDYSIGKMFVSENVDPSCKVIYSLTVEDHNQNTLLINQLNRSPFFKPFIENYKLGNVFFENQKVKNITYEIIKMCVR